MKIYGYKIDTNAEAPMELSEATISAKPKVLREMAAFFEKCASEIEQHGDSWEHEHFESSTTNSNAPSLVVFNQAVE